MARGKKTSPEVVYKVMVSYAITHNNVETARQLGIPESTVRKIVEDNKKSDEFRKLCDQKKDEFAEKTSRIIDKLLARIENEVLDEEKDIPLNHLTTAMGTLYDKRALSRGETTQNIDFATNFDIGKLIDIAGYTKKGDE
jgi:Asp-tRNA(Asn)/Glu-tRNA(Gln) amidotransferase B subunit